LGDPAYLEVILWKNWPLGFRAARFIATRFNAAHFHRPVYSRSNGDQAGPRPQMTTNVFP